MAQKIELKGKSFLTLKDFSKEEIKYFLSLASYLKTKKKILLQNTESLLQVLQDYILKVQSSIRRNA